MKLAFLLFAAVLIVSVIADSSNGNGIIQRIDQAQEEIDSRSKEASLKLSELPSRRFEIIESSYSEFNEKTEGLVRDYKFRVDGIIGTDSDLTANPDRANCRQYFDEYLNDTKHKLEEYHPSSFSQKLVSTKYGKLLDLITKTKLQLNEARNEASAGVSDRDKFVQEKITQPLSDLFMLFDDFNWNTDERYLLMEYNKITASILKTLERDGELSFEKTAECENKTSHQHA